MFVSVIIPVFNGGESLRQCLHALQQTIYEPWECIVVDDGSTDNSVAVARQFGARVISTAPRRSGPARARNLGAHAARGDLLFFVDADVGVTPGAMGHAVATLQADPELAACFGSYDNNPTARNFLSQYRNLLHHYVHQNSNPDASTFWSGCGMIRRDVFLQANGFDTVMFDRPSIEDIELGYRLRAAGHPIRLEKLLQVQHMKRWTAVSILITDVRDRALPWTRLIVRAGTLPNDLNLQTTQRLSTLLTFAAAAALGGGFFWRPAWLLLPLLLAALYRLNAAFYQFLRTQRGAWFMLRALPWHWVYFFYSGITFGLGVLWYGLLRPDGEEAERPYAPAVDPQPTSAPVE